MGLRVEELIGCGKAKTRLCQYSVGSHLVMGQLILPSLSFPPGDVNSLTLMILAAGEAARGCRVGEQSWHEVLRS